MKPPCFLLRSEITNYVLNCAPLVPNLLLGDTLRAVARFSRGWGAFRKKSANDKGLIGVGFCGERGVSGGEGRRSSKFGKESVFWGKMQFLTGFGDCIYFSLARPNRARCQKTDPFLRRSVVQMSV